MNTNIKKTSLIDMDMLTFVSHELKTPLSTLKLNVEMLKKELLNKQTSGKEKNLIDIMDEEVEWMIHFISDTLDLRTMEHKIPLNLNWHKWNQWIKKIYNTIENKVNLSGRKLKITFPNQETEVYMDPLYIRQVLFNLIMNGVEHSPENSTIDIKWKVNDTFHVYITDQGPGIDPKDTDKIFEPFYKNRDKENRMIKGSGLGLAIVRRIIQAHEGRAYALNRSPSNDKGAVFVFTLPHKLVDL